MADPDVQKKQEVEKFRLYTEYLDRRETRKATRELCELMEHESVGCSCFENIHEEKPPERPRFIILQPDSKFNNRHDSTVSGIFVTSLAELPNKRKKFAEKEKSIEDADTVKKQRKPYAYKSNEGKGTAETRREIKKKLFMDLGIIRTNCGIDNEEKKREEAMKRKVTETIVTTYCELCEQNFSSSKMLLLHRSKVHDSSTLECHLCLKRFDQTLHFNRHMKTHYGPNAKFHVQCEQCERQFKDKESLKTHMQVSHRNEQQPLR